MELDHAIWLVTGIAVGLAAAMLILAAMMVLDSRYIRRHRRLRAPAAAPGPVPDAPPARAVADAGPVPAPSPAGATGARPAMPPPDPIAQPVSGPQPAAPASARTEPGAKEEPGQGPPAARVDVPALFEQAFTGTRSGSPVGTGSAPAAPRAAPETPGEG